MFTLAANIPAVLQFRRPSPGGQLAVYCNRSPPAKYSICFWSSNLLQTKRLLVIKCGSQFQQTWFVPLGQETRSNNKDMLFGFVLFGRSSSLVFVLLRPRLDVRDFEIFNHFHGRKGSLPKIPRSLKSLKTHVFTAVKIRKIKLSI